MKKCKKFIVTISNPSPAVYLSDKIIVEKDITDLGTSDMWAAVKEMVNRFCFVGMKLQLIVFCEEERPVCGINDLGIAKNKKILCDPLTGLTDEEII
jgi:hypothetical protein